MSPVVARVEREPRAFARRFVAKVEIVVHELAPDPGPLSESVLGEDVLAGVVEHPVAHVPDRGTAVHHADAIGVVRGGDAQVSRVRAPPIAVAQIVVVAVERSGQERVRGRGAGCDRKDDDRDQEREGGAKFQIAQFEPPAPSPSAKEDPGESGPDSSPFTRAAAERLMASRN